MKFIKFILNKIGIYNKILKIPCIKKAKIRYGIKINRKRKEAFDKYGQECLKKINNVLTKHEVIFWLDYGTLLGAIRENDFIEHDLDLDFGMDIKSNPILVKNILNNNGFSLVKEFILDGQIVEQTFSYKGVTFDIFYYLRDNEYMWTYSFTKRDKKILKYENDKKIFNMGFKCYKVIMKNRGLKKMTFKGDEYNIPSKTHEYLIENYGENYMTPVKEWDFIDSPSNMKEIDYEYSIEIISKEW